MNFLYLKTVLIREKYQKYIARFEKNIVCIWKQKPKHKLYKISLK